MWPDGGKHLGKPLLSGWVRGGDPLGILVGCQARCARKPARHLVGLALQ
jgi:hypothetical protein